MAESGLTEGTEWVLAKAINMVVTEYVFDEVVFLRYAHYGSLIGQASNTMAFTRYAKNTYETPANEAASLTPVAWNPTSVDVATSRRGVAREPTESLLESTVLGRAKIINDLIIDSARLLGLADEELYAAEFVNATGGTVTIAGDLTVAGCVQAMGRARNAKVRGPMTFNLGDMQLQDLQVGQAAATATPWASFYTPNADGSNFGGYFMGATVWASGLNPTVNTAANVVGSLYADGGAAPNYCAYAYVVKRVPGLKTIDVPLKDTMQMAMIGKSGVGTKAANFAVKITTAAT